MKGMKVGLWLFLALFVFWGIRGWAQVANGTIQGTVTDSSGAVLPNASVEIVNEGTGASRTVAADASGHYTAPSLAVGKYKITASMSGFENETLTGVDLAVGQLAVIDLKLQVGAVSQTVEVTGEAPLVETTEATVSYIVGDRTMRDLPLNGRDMSQLILLNPGIVESTTPGAQAYNGYGRRISIAGMRGEDNIYYLDGGMIGDFRRHIPAGPSGSLLGLETVQEFQVLSNSLPAQYGRMLGGVFNSVSKSGSNEFHGDLYEYLRNDDLDAKKWEDNAYGNGVKPPFKRNQFGATIGGPIKKDKMFFFAGYEGTRESLSTTQVAVVPAANVHAAATALMAPYMALYPLPTPGLPLLSTGTNGTGNFVSVANQPTVESFGQARMDLPTITAKDSFFVRFTGSNSTRSAPGNATGAAAAGFPGYFQVSSLGTELSTVSETHIFSPTTLNTMGFHFNRVTPLDTGVAPPPLPGEVLVPGVSVSPEFSPGNGVTAVGGTGFDTNPTQMTSNRFTFDDDVHMTLGSHSLTWGGMFERFQLNSAKYNRYFGVWSSSSVSNFSNGLFTTFRGAVPPFGTYRRGFRNLDGALYLQDDWRVTPKLTVNMGIRWEPYSVPTEVNGLISNLRHITDTTGTVGSPYWQNESWLNLEPRFGFAWNPTAKGNTSVRGGFGLFYEPNDPNQYYSQMDRQPPLGYDFTIPDTKQFPNAQAEIAAQSTQGPAYEIPYVNNRSPHALQYNMSVQQQLGANDLLSVGYVGSRGINILEVGDADIPATYFDGTSLAVPAGSGPRYPAWSQINYFPNDTNSWYNGLLVSFQRRFSHGLQMQASYTWSHSEDQSDSGQTGGGVTAGGGRVKDIYDLAAQTGLSGYNFTHVVQVNYTYDLPYTKGKGIVGHILSGWETTGVLSARSGEPLDVGSTDPSLLSSIGSIDIVSPNAVAGCNNLTNPGNPNHYINLACFTAPGPLEIGNEGRNTLITPGSISWNPALFKTFSVGERFHLQFRAETFNVLNRANFGQPASSLFGATSATGVPGAPTGNAGQITNTLPVGSASRQIQFALKLLW